VSYVNYLFTDIIHDVRRV